MPTSFKDIQATSHMRSKYGRRKKGVYETEVRYVAGEIARPGSTTVKKFSKAKVVGKIQFNIDGTYALAKTDED
ncbi:hypothetical protein GR217_37155 [Rhizobium leguminosarum]|uniref:Uncharacterized protein n=1 Tax=Rhizobium ruizarguesonis TaxID=2081791 RepID=A0AAE5C509_9HYPH|nr:hypothetical protein [Rhizobium ruizarguesonis]NEI53218.1 hypothetical protein [Rhizobium ruizarguesonis]